MISTLSSYLDSFFFSSFWCYDNNSKYAIHQLSVDACIYIDLACRWWLNFIVNNRISWWRWCYSLWLCHHHHTITLLMYTKQLFALCSIWSSSIKPGAIHSLINHRLLLLIFITAYYSCPILISGNWIIHLLLLLDTCVYPVIILLLIY